MKASTIFSGIALLCSFVIFLSTGGFTAGSTLQDIRGEIKLLRHEVIAANALQDAEISAIKKSIYSNKP
jgi:hypothetical protein